MIELWRCLLRAVVARPASILHSAPISSNGRAMKNSCCRAGIERVAAIDHRREMREPHALIARSAACCLLIIATLHAASIFAAESMQPARIQAVRSDWSAAVPPVEGWVDVRLPDDWSRRWDQFDGVVWYRVTWIQPSIDGAAAAFIEYLNMAGTIALNDSLLVRDRSLVEPLARMWNTPRYLALPAPLLHSGENILLFRISGLAAYQPGLGPVTFGTAQAMSALYEREFRWRYDLQIFGLAVGVSLGSFFLVLWLMRRRETAYGWFGALQLAWVVIAVNQVTTSTWPLPSTDLWEAANTIGLLVFMACWGTFVLRFCERRWPRIEAAMWIAVALGSLWLLVAPHSSMRESRDSLTVLSTAIGFVWNMTFVALAWRRDGRVDQRLLSICALIWLAAGVHDVFVFTRLLDSNMYYSTLAENVSVIAIALVLSWNFVHNLRRIEGFNSELLGKVEAARRELAQTLQRQHELEVLHARRGERLDLAHDLHDGLSGTLISNIIRLEHAPESMTPAATLAALKELRDDLHLIIDTSSGNPQGRNSLADALAPLRFRMTRLFEGHEVECRWTILGLDEVYLTNTQSLDLLRIVQEALTNVLKHARATLVDVQLARSDAGLQMIVSDDGVGLPAEHASRGNGFRSMSARAQRLGAKFDIGAHDGRTRVYLSMPIAVNAIAVDDAKVI
jgi:signal transduction histidine kinase